MKRSKRISIRVNRLPWLLTAVFLFLFLCLLAEGKWRSTGTGAQVQVPMFYDAHYLFPRPWTQAQAAPGIPAPAPVAFYGANTISQPFISRADHLGMVEIWLAGAEETAVTATLTTPDGKTFKAEFPLTQGKNGGLYRLSFPPISDAKDRTYIFTLAAPDATIARPVITHSIGGDRVGGAIHLNEYGRPGNLELYTYVSGTAILDALAEQLLPDLFRSRLQQFKPAAIKGSTFAFLSGLLVVLSVLFLLLARPSGQTLSQAVGWTLAGLLAGLLIWQFGDGRLRLPLLHQTINMIESQGELSGPLETELRVVNDMSLALWTANREPEERFIETAFEGLPAPAIHVPGNSALEYALDVPRNGRLETAVYAAGSGEMRFSVMFNNIPLAEIAVGADGRERPLSVDLAEFAGRGGQLQLTTEVVSGEPEGYWFQPQLLARVDWLLPELPEKAEKAGYQIGEDILLLGVEVKSQNENLLVTLFWQTKRPLTENATVFVHLLDENGELLAQSDAQPVQNSYPLSVWPAGLVIADAHQLPQVEAASLAVGLYNPTDFKRCPVTNPDGSMDPDGRVLIPLNDDN